MCMANFDKETFEKLCKLQSTVSEIAAYFELTIFQLKREINKTYKTKDADVIIERYHSLGNINLREAQYEQALKNPVMAIWLGKQFLAQKDIVENNTNETITFIDDIKRE